MQEKMIWNGRQVKQGKFFLVSVFITSCSLVVKYFNTSTAVFFLQIVATSPQTKKP